MKTKTTTALLTRAQKQVLLFLAVGLTEEEVADKLGITYDTVHNHGKAIHKRLKASNTAMALGKAIVTGEERWVKM